MKKGQEIKSLIRECVIYLQEENYSKKRVADYQRLWRDGIEEFMCKNTFSIYDADIGEDFLGSISGISDSYMRTIRRSVHVLTDFLSSRKVRKRIVCFVNHELSGEIGDLAWKFIESQDALRRSKLTLNEHQRILSYFIQHLSLRAVFHASEISEEDVLAFISSAQNCKDKFLNTSRLFCRFLYEKKYIERNVEYVIGRNNFPQREKLPSVYDPEEIKRIEGAVGQSSHVGKRDYAMLLLTTRLGLRSSDIAGLRFENLDWDKNMIRLFQYKTKREIELPLLVDVGESIINYLKYGRPVSELPQVFLSACAPYISVNRLIINGAISRIIKASGVDITRRKFGPHAMRHTLASQLLSNGASLPIISEALGHSDTQVTMNYLRIDLRNLMRCSLAVPLVSIAFYEQKGGVFYE